MLQHHKVATVTPKHPPQTANQQIQPLRAISDTRKTESGGLNFSQYVCIGLFLYR